MKHIKYYLFASFAALAIVSVLAFKPGAEERTKITYCIITGTRQLLSNKVTITIDSGTERPFLSDARLKDDLGNVEKFNSMVDALNFMNEKGWALVQAYPVTISNVTFTNFILKKEEKVTDGK